MATTFQSVASQPRKSMAQRNRLGDLDLTNVILSTYLSVGIAMVFLWTYPATRHWFVLPTMLCGVIIGIDAIRWLRGQLDLFDPIGLGGLLGFHFFFLAPLLTVVLKNWWPSWFLNAPPDWRPWLGIVSILNIVGLSFYRIARSVVFPRGKSPVKSKTFWEIDRNRVAPVLIVALLGTAVLQLFTYIQYGGLSGYISAFEDQSFAGMGWLFMLSESFPILFFIGYALMADTRPGWRSWLGIFVAMVLFFILKMLFGGLRGSRSNTVWGLFWAVGIVQFWIRPLGRKMVLLGLAFLVAFLFVYGFYKNYGSDAWDAYQSAGSVSALEEESGRSWETVALGDLSRSYVQAFIVYRLKDEFGATWYQYRDGATYLSALMLPIPDLIPIPRPDNKTSAGADLMYGQGGGYYNYRSSWIYGLLGEAILNFGIFVAPLAFVLWGGAVGFTGKWLYTWEKSDARWLLLPFAINIAVIAVSSDLDNIVFVTIKNGFVPAMVIFLVSNQRHNLPLGGGNAGNAKM